MVVCDDKGDDWVAVNLESVGRVYSDDEVAVAHGGPFETTCRALPEVDGFAVEVVAWVKRPAWSLEFVGKDEIVFFAIEACGRLGPGWDQRGEDRQTGRDR